MTNMDKSKNLTEVTVDDATLFIETACRNWGELPELDRGDIDDVRVALEQFAKVRAPLVLTAPSGDLVTDFCAAMMISMLAHGVTSGILECITLGDQHRTPPGALAKAVSAAMCAIAPPGDHSADLIRANAECAAIIVEQMDAIADLVSASKGLIPTNLSLVNCNLPDEHSVPIDVTLGELRAIRDAIVKAGAVP